MSEPFDPTDLPAPTANAPVDTDTGLPTPLGTYPFGEGTNFAIFSRNATRIWLELFADRDDEAPTHRIELDPDRHRTGDIWHVWVEGVGTDQFYGYRAEGPYEPRGGHRFNPHRLLIDPYAGAITHRADWDFHRAAGYDPDSPQKDLSFWAEDNAGGSPKCVVTDRYTGWERTRHIGRPWSETVIYELHVRGFTIHPSSGVDCAGTFRGLTEKIPYLKDLGVTAVELMPVYEFNEDELGRLNPLSGEELHNYWGYNPVAFMAPNGAYAHDGSSGEQVHEFKEMVAAFHEAEIEVILDVVYNHTAEGSELGPTVSWRGLDNSVYYLLEEDRRFYRDFTGTGNTVKSDHPVVRDLILDSLRRWVVEMHVDGFRFDLASVLGRDEEGQLRADAPLIERIAEDPVLRNVKMIAEAWDASGAYQVGSFYQPRWSEWNGRYRDEVRRFWRGDGGMIDELASRLTGSADLYGAARKGPQSSINYVTSHDGFTLNDLVSYEHKHNEANGEGNRDGTDANYSANYGEEGPTDDHGIEAVRRRQIKNFLLTLFVSQGVPMLLGGDEFRRTQEGNNNAYCQDNEVGWWIWDRFEEHQEIHRFARAIIAFRQEHPVLRRTEFYEDGEIDWFGPDGAVPDWKDEEARELGARIRGEDREILLLFNASPEEITFELPPPPDGTSWRRRFDTGRAEAEDVVEESDAGPIEETRRYALAGRSSAILVSGPAAS